MSRDGAGLWERGFDCPICGGHIIFSYDPWEHKNKPYLATCWGYGCENRISPVRGKTKRDAMNELQLEMVE